MHLDLETFSKEFVNAWNSHDVFKVLKFYSEDLVYIHQGEEPRVIRGKKKFRTLSQRIMEIYSRL